MRIAGPNLVIGSMLFLVVFGISAATLFGLSQLIQAEEPAVAAGIGGGDDAASVPSETGILDLAAINLLFNQDTLVVSAGTEVTIVFDNQDAGVLHNIAVYTDNSTSEVIFQGEIFPGPETRDETFTAPAAPGNYFFRCDVHPDTMSGTLVVR